MRKIPPKDPTNISTSLALPEKLGNDIDGRIKRNAQTTHERRLELINVQSYTDTDLYNSRYKQSDVKTAIKKHYHSKCAFCEQRVEAFHIEHYRPKSIYYWLAYSWDNLLLACSTCNQHKGNKFEIQGTKAVYQTSDLPEIHSLCEKYNQTEQPKLLHPEFDNFEDIWHFDRKGNIASTSDRGKYTILVCRLDREELNDLRKEVLEDFMEELESIMFSPSKAVEIDVTNLLKKFRKKAENEKKDFLAFRNYVLEHIIPTILQELLT